MANTIKHKRTKDVINDGKGNLSPKSPTTAQITQGEIVLNYGVGVESAFIKNYGGNVVKLNKNAFDYAKEKLGFDGTEAEYIAEQQTIVKSADVKKIVMVTAYPDVEEPGVMYCLMDNPNI